MISLQAVTKQFPTKLVLDRVDWHVHPGERVGLVGANGAGKSTLLKILLGEVDVDAGVARVRAGARIGYLSQELPGLAGRTLQAEMWTVFHELSAVADELSALAERLALTHDPDQLASLTHEQDERTHRYELMGGYTAETRIGKVLSGLGFQEADRARRVETFSGGWQMRVMLAKLLLAAPELLMLDEPTNHLDLNAIEWLEEYLRDYPGTLLLISHDRRFLDRVVTRIGELEFAHLTDYPGSYTHYLELKAEVQAATEAAYERQQRELAKQTAFIERFRASATRSTQAKSREKQLAKVERIEAPREAKQVRFRFPPAPPGGQVVIRTAGVSRAYDGKQVLRGIDLRLERGERVALVGPNGCGKSTLIRLLAQVEEPDEGEVFLGYNIKPAYYSQNQAEGLDECRTVLDEAYHSADGWTLERTRSLLGRFLFSGEDVTKPVAKLSGGERARLALAKLMMRPANLLLLDEPTNHLDLASKEVLAEALCEFAGSVLLISHDRHLLDQVATHVFTLEGGQLRRHVGNYTAYREGQTPTAAPAAAPRPAPVLPVVEARPKLNAFQRARTLEALEAEIAELEGELEVLEALVADPDLYADHLRAAVVAQDYEEKRARHDEAMEQWLALSEG